MVLGRHLGWWRSIGAIQGGGRSCTLVSGTCVHWFAGKRFSRNPARSPRLITSKRCGVSTATHPLDVSRFHLFRSTRGALPYELILPLACRTEGNWSNASGSRFSAAGAIASQNPKKRTKNFSPSVMRPSNTQPPRDRPVGLPAVMGLSMARVIYRLGKWVYR